MCFKTLIVLIFSIGVERACFNNMYSVRSLRTKMENKYLNNYTDHNAYRVRIKP